MKMISFIVLILFSTFSLAKAQSRNDVYGHSVGNGMFLSFINKVVCNARDTSSAERCLSRQQLAWQKQEIVKWKSAIRKAVDMLPRKFFRKVGVISLEFFIDRSDWATGTASAGSSVRINLLSDYENTPKWMTWEPLRKNDFSEAEMVWVALHEMAHVYSRGGELDVLNEELVEYRPWTKWGWDKSTKQFLLLSGVEENHTIIVKERETTLYGEQFGQVEDFAETFALYVMWPEYLKDNFQIHYGVIKNILGVEYLSEYSMPNSIKSKLILKEGVKIEN